MTGPRGSSLPPARTRSAAGAVLQDLFHRLDIEALQCDVLRHFEGAVDRGEAVGVTLRAGDDFGAIGLGILAGLDRHATRPRQDVVAVGLGLVAQALAIGQCALHVAERVDDRGRRIDLGHLHLGDHDAGAVGIEDALQQVLGFRFDLAAALGERLRDLGLADDLAHRAFGGGLHGRLGRPDMEQVGLCVLDDPKDGEVDVDDVLVAGQHQRLFRQLARAGGATLARAIADLGAVDAGDARRQHALDRGRQMVIEPRLGRAVIGAEAQHDADLVRLHPVEAARHP